MSQEDITENPVYRMIIVKDEDEGSPVEAVTVSPGILEKVGLLKNNEIVGSDLAAQQICRVCGVATEEDEFIYVINPNNLRLTNCGLQLHALLDTEEIDFSLPHQCCGRCASKIRICFSLLVEIQASQKIVKQTQQLDETQDEQYPLCDKCNSCIKGEFIEHYEEHLLGRNVKSELFEGYTEGKCVDDFIDESQTGGEAMQGLDESALGLPHFLGEEVQDVDEDVKEEPLQLLEIKKSCPFCHTTFKSKAACLSHVKKHHSECAGMIPKKTQSPMMKKKLNKFDKAHELPQSSTDCSQCSLHFEDAELLHEHTKIVHGVELTSAESRFACTECDKKFPDMFLLKAHLKLIHEIKDDEILLYKSFPVYRSIECNMCNLTVNSENSMRIHLKTDHGLKNNQMEILKKACEKCGKKFASKQNLIHHINSAHLNFKPMQCDVCNERFAKHSSLIYHRLRHTGEKPFECELCHQTYRQRNDVIRHLARHVRDNEIGFEEASALNNSNSQLVLKRRIFLRDSNINYTLFGKKRRGPRDRVMMKSEQQEEVTTVEVPSIEVEFEIPMSPVYEEVVVGAPDTSITNFRPVYGSEKKTIILAQPSYNM